MTETLDDTAPPGALAGGGADAPAPRRRPALSPSRAGDFKQCPLLYRFRAIDRLPELPTRPQVRGTLVHAVLERLFELPAAERLPATAAAMVEPVWAELCASWPELLELLFTGPDDPELGPWLGSAGPLLEAYFRLEDPRLLDPQARELLVETELESGLLLRGYIDRLDVAPDGEMRVIDYKTGAAPRPTGETRALFQMKFYALALLHLRGAVPAQLRLLYLADTESLTYRPEEEELRRFEGTLNAIWDAVLRAGRDGDFRPNPGRVCEWCSHKALCPAWDGTPPPYPGWPGDAVDGGTADESRDDTAASGVAGGAHTG
ncbi:RecB family exonuclease [Pseudonocardia humida]|uniref:RecB family exonuclease n=1 Tax=Pseudonocardia humida TaxID=2800819 RepID=A0ABT0ZZ81_9PSEU|nr:RecB family exonuclease [Pseudonocardia humida]MCO1656053.1 RecB family exonuclease [Pseudonocardia humida]